MCVDRSLGMGVTVDDLPVVDKQQRFNRVSRSFLN